MAASTSLVTQEIKASTADGYLMFVVGLALLVSGPWLVMENPDRPPMGWVIALVILGLLTISSSKVGSGAGPMQMSPFSKSIPLCRRSIASAFESAPGPAESCGLSASIFLLASMVSIPERGSIPRISTAWGVSSGPVTTLNKW